MHPSIRPFESIYPTLGERVYIDPTAVVIGDVTLADDVSVWPMAVIRGDVNSIHISEGCNIQDAAILHATHEGPFTPGGRQLYLGKNVTVGHQAVLHACHIEGESLIGIGALILDAVHIEQHVMVAAGSVVPPGKRLLSGYLYLGSPARAVRHLTEDELTNLNYSANHYIKLKAKYL
ncbi:MAG: gamma carbonic anhydrase family protein [Legionella sp.]|nr:gamma carbonic anhydrase family protein [Legionella sp.]